jgi:hypothetical protein
MTTEQILGAMMISFAVLAVLVAWRMSRGRI